MASYSDLYNEYKSDLLLQRVTSAIFVAADTVLNEDIATVNHANRLIWARDVFTDPTNHARPFLSAILGANNAATITQIQGSTDAQIQTNVNAAIDVFAGV